MKKQTYRCEDNKYKELQKRLIDDDMSFQGFVDWCVSQYLKKNYNPKEEMKMLREKMINEMIGNNSLMTSGELKKNDRETWEWFKDKLQSYVITEAATEEDMKLFDSGEYLVQQSFEDGGCRYYAGGTKQDIANQPLWGEDSWEDWELDDIKTYYNLVK